MSGIVGTSHSKSGVVGKSQDTAKAWINIDGTGTALIRDSFNVSSITDNGTGEYAVNLIKPMANDKYSVAGVAQETGAGYGNLYINRGGDFLGTGGFILQCIDQGSNYIDIDYVLAQVFGD